MNVTSTLLNTKCLSFLVIMLFSLSGIAQNDLSLSQSISISSGGVGDAVTVTVTVTNEGGTAIPAGTTVAINLSPGLSYVSSNATDGSTWSGAGVWSMNAIGIGTATVD